MENVNTITTNYINGTIVSYQVTFTNTNRILSVPKVEDNADYQAILEWVAEGNTITDNGGGE